MTRGATTQNGKLDHNLVFKIQIEIVRGEGAKRVGLFFVVLPDEASMLD